MSNLQEEHIIPLSLAGKWVLPEASCKSCAKATGADEGYCAGQTLKPARTHFAWRSRKSKKPISLRAGNLIGRTGTWQEVPVEYHPPCVVLPHFLSPGLLGGNLADPGAIFVTGVNLYSAPEFASRLRALGPKGAIYTRFRADAFCRMLAKIAHAFTAAELGIDNFNAFLPGVVLGSEPDFARFAGSFEGDESPTDDLHTLRPASMEPLIVVKVRLYARYGVPRYTVAAGRISPKKL